ncbi:L,D-transpeptidase [Nitratireductor pacificus]|uniref:ErfK/YbiS/YcfS/YnhG family protein n=1 Tax=Nitratireductor pacificus pht-3B TaxID=391937 RepID=K2M9M1_9HYPH|nr:L,D-transpeptidase [Nitratireductor pacificus]EKF17695.1 ErfK/YbiS/YcfS/YnhG family protein [Nitratireductor pacificus pht-3B]
MPTTIPLLSLALEFALKVRGDVRAATPGKSLLAQILLATACLLAASAAVAESRYDPRTWSFDPARGTVISPSELEASAPSPERRPAARPQLVSFQDAHPAGSIVVRTSERWLYLVLGGGKALRYAVGVGREGFEWSGSDRISAKKEWPDWRPPAEMRRREAAMGRQLPAHVAGGPDNPLGARALYIGDTLYRIHGTNQPWTVGEANSSGCIRMTNDDVIDLYGRVSVGARVTVQD